ncbi:MAG: amidase [Betaproteobacteria bacterium]|nr:amidase [Betaproteobacteria bacterium]
MPVSTIAQAARLLSRGELSAVELTEMTLRRIDALDAQLSAFITLTAERALEQARAADREIAAGRYRGPLHGIPIGLKDLFYTRGILTSGHSKIGIDHVPSFDATTSAKLFEAGALLMGKLATHEFAHGGPSFDLPWPPARNPWNTAHFTGGSSSGSAAAVAAGLVFGALGSDTGGSIRTPASYCGVVGLKPTYGLVSRHGVIPNSFSLDHCGPLTWTVEDCAIMLQAIAGYDSKDPSSINAPVPDYPALLAGGIKGMRLGVLRHLWEEDLPADDELCQAMEDAIGVLRELGAVVETARIWPAQHYYDVKVIISESEAFCIQQRDLTRRPGDYGAHYLGRVLVACLFQSADYVRAHRQRRRLVEEMLPLYEKYDALVTAGMGPAPRLESHRSIGFWDKWQKPSITTVFDVTGGPALMLCNGFARSGMPLGMQIAGRPFDDATVLRVANAYEQATAWRTRRPPLVAGARAPDVVLSEHGEAGPKPDPGMRQLVEALVGRAGLTLPEPVLQQLCEAAPYALAMVSRLPMHSWPDEPANVFRFPEAWHAWAARRDRGRRQRGKSVRTASRRGDAIRKAQSPRAPRRQGGGT